MLAVWILGVLLFSFSLRAYPGLLAYFRDDLEYTGANDSYSALNIIESIRNNNHRTPEVYPNFLPHRPIGYPLFMHWLLSFLPPATTERLVAYWGAIVETLHTLVIMLFAYWLIGTTTFGETVPLIPGVLLSGILFAVAPTSVRATNGPGLILSARPLGSFFFTVSLFFLLAWQYSNETGYLFLSALFHCAVLVTHKFATQATWFVLTTLAVIYGDVRFGILFLAVVSLTILLTKGYYLRVLHGHLAYIRYWTMHQFLPQWGPTVNRELLSFWDGQSLSKTVLNLIPDSPRRLWSSDFSAAYMYNPAVVLALLLVLTDGVTTATLPLLAWLFALIFAHLIVLVPVLRYIGEPGRYLQYSLAPVALLGPYALYSVDIGSGFQLGPFGPVSALFGLVLAYAVALSLREIRLAGKLKTQTSAGHASSMPLREWLSSKPQSNVLFIPTYESKYLLPYVDHDFLRPRAPDHTSSAKRELMSRTLEYIGSPNPDLSVLADIYDLDMVIFEKEFIAESPVGYSQPEAQPLYEDERFIIYSMDSVQEDT